MQAYAMVSLVRTWDRFKPERSDNAFAFYTQCIKNSFKQYLKDEKKHRIARDELLLDRGMTPSYTYQLDHNPGSYKLVEGADVTASGGQKPMTTAESSTGYDGS